MSIEGRLLSGIGGVWHALTAYLRPGHGAGRGPVSDRAALARFLDTRASYVAQTALYGYLRTRAGMRYPALFDDDRFVASINVAKWYVWIACLSDLAVYAGGLLAHGHRGAAAEVGAVMREVVDGVFAGVGVPPDAGDGFEAQAARVRERIARCEWRAVADDGSAFTESPTALVRHAPVIDELKALDEEIVRNSVRFRWQEVRRELRRELRVGAVMGPPPAQ